MGFKALVVCRVWNISPSRSFSFCNRNWIVIFEFYMYYYLFFYDFSLLSESSTMQGTNIRYYCIGTCLFFLRSVDHIIMFLTHLIYKGKCQNLLSAIWGATKSKFDPPKDPGTSWANYCIPASWCCLQCTEAPCAYSSHSNDANGREHPVTCQFTINPWS